MKTINFLLIILLITGCNPCKRLQKHCPPIIKDSISYVETIKLDTILYALPGDTTILEIPVDLTDYSLSEENAKQKIQLNILKGKLILITICKDDSLQVVITNLETKLSEQTTVIVEKPVPVYKSRKIFVYSFFILIGVILLSIGWTFLKYKAKILGLLGK